jgi:hypothetical protein
MARRSSVEAVLTAIVTVLRASAGVTALTATGAGSIVNNVPQDTPYPYVEVTSPTDRREDTCGRFGSSVLVDVKVISQARGDQEAARLLAACVQALDFQKPALTAHTTLGLTWESSDRFRDVVNAIVTRYHVATFRAWTEQSST